MPLNIDFRGIFFDLMLILYNFIIKLDAYANA